jgi:7-cyano-7-deazaguanine reductase
MSETHIDSGIQIEDTPAWEPNTQHGSTPSLPGESAIAAAELEILPNPSTGRDYVIHYSYPEFTCKCPRTGYPDFATINLWIIPDDSIVELKSLKLYMNKFRDTYVFHEAVTNELLDRIVDSLQPKWARIVAEWNPRGNLTTVISSEHRPENRPPEHK